jgi:hypothetical protein
MQTRASQTYPDNALDVTLTSRRDGVDHKIMHLYQDGC